MVSDTKGRTVVLNGAAGGLGQAIPRALVAAGRCIVLVDRNEDSQTTNNQTAPA